MVGIHGTHIRFIVHFVPVLVWSHYAGFVVCQQVFSIGLTPLENIIEGNAERRLTGITPETVASQSNISVVVMKIAAISQIAYRAFSGSGFLHLRLIIEEDRTLSCQVQRIFAVPCFVWSIGIPKRRAEWELILPLKAVYFRSVFLVLMFTTLVYPSRMNSAEAVCVTSTDNMSSELTDY